MSTVIVKRSPRVPGPEAPQGQIELAEPPVLGEPPTADFSSALVYLPMALGVGAMGMMFTIGSRSPSTSVRAHRCGMRRRISFGAASLPEERAAWYRARRHRIPR